ncbi:hypothetical protein GYB22_00815 [bacterium]|nr:hypothetical protein [bacterium]
MKLNKSLSLIICALFMFSFQAKASRLLVQYDFLNDDYKYYEVKANGELKEIARPVVTRNHNVKVEVINFNPFVYTAVAQYSTKEITEAPSLGFFNLMNPLGMATGGSSFLAQITGMGDDPTRGSDGVLSEPEARDAYLAVESAYQTLYKAEQMVNNIDFVLNKVHRLKYNPYLPSDSIKSFSQALLSSLFEQPSVETQDFLVLGNEINRTVKGGYASIAAQVERFNKAYKRYEERSRSQSFEGQGLDQVVSSWGYQVQQFVSHFDSDALLEKLDALEMMYLSVMNTPFNFNTNDIAKGDEITVTIDFYRNPVGDDGLPQAASVAALENLQKIKSKEIDITVKGDLKINSSLGVAFPYYSDNYDFINRDSMITSVDGNNYTPNIAAYLNFYPYTGRNVMFGGTFGVGVPISDDTKNFNFLLGGSMIFGTDNRLVLNAGATLGQVNRLDLGYNVGDNLGDLTSAVPVRTSYQWGYFVGISFSLMDIKN